MSNSPETPPETPPETAPDRLISSTESQPIRNVTRDGVHYTLLGTAHVSKTSAEVVAQMAGSGDYDSRTYPFIERCIFCQYVDYDYGRLRFCDHTNFDYCAYAVRGVV